MNHAEFISNKIESIKQRAVVQEGPYILEILQILEVMQQEIIEHSTHRQMATTTYYR